jgi:hypothetical protein
MLFFRSEEQVDRWCADRRLPRRPTATLPQLWQMGLAWYANRLSPDARRPGPDEIRNIFASIGLHGSFWNPEADELG